MKTAILTLVAAAALAAPALASAAPIADADYDGKSTGDGQAVSFHVSADGGSVRGFVLDFSADCVEGGDHFELVFLELSFRRATVRADGTFARRTRVDGKGWAPGADALVKGSFSGDGKTASVKFSFRGKSKSGNPRTRCKAKDRFEARTEAVPTSEHAGHWSGTTAYGGAIGFQVSEFTLTSIEFWVDVTCVRDPGAPGEPTFVREHHGVIDEGRVEGDGFEAAEGVNRMTGTFGGRRGSGTVTVAEYHDDALRATCSSGGEVPFALERA